MSQGQRNDIRSTTYSDLTVRQAQAIAAFRDHLSRLGYPPTVKEVSALLGLRYQGARRLLVELEAKGYLTMRPGKWRSMTLTGKGEEARLA